MKIIQRLGSDAQYDENYINGLLSLKRQYPDSYNDVWLATDYGFPKLSVHADHAKVLAKIADRFRAEGVSVSLQLSNSIGHGQYMSAKDCTGLVYDGSPVAPMVGHDGQVAHYCFCFRGEEFTNYVTKELSLYCEAIHPEYVWVDDDLRADGHAPVTYGCFCDDCIAKFNEEQNTDFTRESLVNELLCGDIRMREAFIQFNRRGLGELACKMAKAIHDVSPESSFALQNGYHPYTGGNYGFVFDNVRQYSDKAPAYRGGGGAYNDHDPNGIFRKTVDVMLQNSTLPDYVRLRVPEIENLPFVFSGKSPAGDMLESALELAAGNTGLSYSMMMRFSENESYYAKHLALLEKMYPYFEKLAEVSERTRGGGIFYAMPQKSYLRKPYGYIDFSDITITDFHSADALMRDGVPFTFEDNGTAVLLTRENAYAMSDDEIKALLGRGVITDGEALDVLQSRGFDFGCTARQIDPAVAGRYHERFTSDALNPQGRTTLVISNFVPGGNAPRYTFDTLPDGARILGNYEADVEVKIDKVASVATFIFKTKQGGTFAVFGYGLYVGIVPKYAIDRLIGIADEICVNRLPAVLRSESQAFLYPRVNTENKTVSVSVANATPGEDDDIEIAVRDPASDKCIFMSQYGKTEILTAKEENGSLIFRLPPLAAYSVGTIFFD